MNYLASAGNDPPKIILKKAAFIKFDKLGTIFWNRTLEFRNTEIASTRLQYKKHLHQ